VTGQGLVNIELGEHPLWPTTVLERLKLPTHSVAGGTGGAWVVLLSSREIITSLVRSVSGQMEKKVYSSQIHHRRLVKVFPERTNMLRQDMIYTGRHPRSIYSCRGPGRRRDDEKPRQ
jgi:hypothetical protein